jgi:2-polyprenyl-6-methoxyphenol hydroxylase-like FAD-dependent oxidoreductase
VVDAAVLADALNEEATVARALARYDRIRRGPTRRIVAASRFLNRISTTGPSSRTSRRSPVPDPR